MEFEWNIFPGFTTLQLINKVQEFMNKMSEPEQFQGRSIFMSMFHDIIWRNRDNETEYSQKDFKQDVGHSSDFGQKQSGIPPTMKDLEQNGTESLN